MDIKGLPKIYFRHKESGGDKERGGGRVALWKDDLPACADLGLTDTVRSARVTPSRVPRPPLASRKTFSYSPVPLD